MLCKLYFYKAVNIDRKRFVLKLSFNLNKTFHRHKKLHFKLYAKHDTTKYKSCYFKKPLSLCFYKAQALFILT